MQITGAYRVVNVDPDMTESAFVASLAGTPVPEAEAREAYRRIVALRVSPAFCRFVFHHESSDGTQGICPKYQTKSPGNTRSSRTGKGHPIDTNIARWLGDIPSNKGVYIQYDSWVDGFEDVAFRIIDPTHVYAKAGAVTLEQILPIFAPTSDGNAPADYIAAGVRYMSRILTGSGGGTVPENPTDRLIRMLGERGREVHDVRGKLPVNRAHPYDTMPLGNVRYLIHHWTGDSFSRETIRTITGTDYGVDVIAPNMSVDDELDLLRWYANYHISKDGGTWGGIAYGTLVFPSGRVYVAWNLGTFTYHAYQGANRQSYATCCPNANGALPTPPQLTSLRHVWDLLCFHTPEIPAGHAELYGHTEATFLDSRNQTSCPGTFLGTVRDYRANATPLDVTPGPTEDPNAWQDPETGYWVINLPEAPVLRFWRERGGIEQFGRPIGGLRQDADGVYRQLFENVEIECWLSGWDGKPKPYLRIGGVGRRYAEALARIAELEQVPA